MQLVLVRKKNLLFYHSNSVILMRSFKSAFLCTDVKNTEVKVCMVINIVIARTKNVSNLYADLRKFVLLLHV